MTASAVVAISGDTVVVGARDDDDGGTDSGSAYVFVRSGTSWSQQQKLVASAPATFDLFGHAVAIDGNTVVVGAYQDDDLGNDSGAALVFVRSGTTWSQQQKLFAADGLADDRFGYSVTVSSCTAVIGAPHATNGRGSAYVFVRSGNGLESARELTASDAAPGHSFGRAVWAMAGESVVVGSRDDDDAGCELRVGLRVSCAAGRPGA
jgi:hypothetical protein